MKMYSIRLQTGGGDDARPALLQVLSLAHVQDTWHCRKKSLMVKDHDQLIMYIVVYGMHIISQWVRVKNMRHCWKNHHARGYNKIYKIMIYHTGPRLLTVHGQCFLFRTANFFCFHKSHCQNGLRDLVVKLCTPSECTQWYTVHVKRKLGSGNKNYKIHHEPWVQGQTLFYETLP